MDKKETETTPKKNNSFKTIILSILIVMLIALAARFTLEAINPDLVKEETIETELTETDKNEMINIVLNILDYWLKNQNTETDKNE